MYIKRLTTTVTNNRNNHCLITFYLLVLLISYSLSFRLLITNKKQNNVRLVGGTIAAPHEFPHMVSLQASTLFNHHCGGSLLDHRYVLTAAHCVFNSTNDTPFPASHFTVVIGNSDYSKCPTTIFNQINEYGCIRVRVKRIIPHEAFSFPFNDISLLELETPVPFTSNIRPIGLLNDLLPNEYVVTAVGWGQNPKRTLPENERDDNSKYPASFLAKTFMPIVNEEECNSRGGRDSIAICNGDSGSPIFIPNLSVNTAYLYQIVGLSNAIGGDSLPCNLTNISSQRSIYTSVPQFIDWILSKAKIEFFNGVESLGSMN
ncbi:hypothetical protein ABK040_015083 [Willaertia magna]